MSQVLAPPRLLIVEDEVTTLFALGEFFSDHDFLVDCASNPTEARGLLDAAAYDVLVTDLHLTPNRQCEGLDLLQFARASTPTIRAVLLTAFVTTEIEQAARTMGADVVLAKPIALPLLASVIAQIGPRAFCLDSGPVSELRR